MRGLFIAREGARLCFAFAYRGTVNTIDSPALRAAGLIGSSQRFFLNISGTNSIQKDIELIINREGLMFSLKLAALAVTALVAWNVTPASALTMKECGEAYREAKEGGTLNGMDWTAFRKERCATSAADSVSADTVKTAEPQKKETSATTAPTVAPAGVTFPTTLAAEFKTEKPAKARMKTCLQGYHDNKEAGTLNGLRWIQKGGGYYSLCNARLKAES